MSDLSPEAKAAIRFARNAPGPTAMDDARLRAALARRIPALSNATPGAGTGTGTLTRGGIGSSSVLLTSLGVLVVVSTTLLRTPPRGTAVATQTRTTEAAVVGPRNSPSANLRALTVQMEVDQQTPVRQRAIATRRVRRVSGAMEGATPNLANAAPLAIEPAPPSRIEPPSNDVVAPVLAAPPAIATRTPTTLGEEMRLIAEARTLARADPAAALGVLGRHAMLYPDGVMRDARIAERIRALCALARHAEARLAAVQFLRDSPRSPLAPRVRASCALP